MEQIDHFFSPSTGGWYNEAIHGARQIADPLTEKQIAAKRLPKYRPNPDCAIPADAIAVDHGRWLALLAAGGEGKVITVEAGRVVAIDRQATAEEQLAAIRAKRDRLLAATDAMVAAPDYPLTDEERARLITWRAALRDFPAEIASFLPLPAVEVVWPARPSFIGELGEKL